MQVTEPLCAYPGLGTVLCAWLHMLQPHKISTTGLPPAPESAAAPGRTWPSPTWPHPLPGWDLGRCGLEAPPRQLIGDQELLHGDP
jgi:hypothetical protein